MIYLTCTMIFSVDFAHYGVSCAKIGYRWIVVQVRDKTWFGAKIGYRWIVVQVRDKTWFVREPYGEIIPEL